MSAERSESPEITLEGRQLPKPDHVSRAFWEAAARGELRIQECPACGHRQHYPRALCVRCGAEPGWITASGRGRVHTFTVVRQNLAPPWRDLVPYVVAMIDLDEGPRLMSNLVGCVPDEVHIGMSVEVDLVRVDEDLGVPFFRPVRDGS